MSPLLESDAVRGRPLSCDAPIRELRLSQRFEHPDQTLVLVRFMFGAKQQQPCPM